MKLYVREYFKKIIVELLNGYEIFWHGNGSGNNIALTFDDGPDDRYTSMLLDILKDFNAHATFFLIGEKIDRNKDIVSRMLTEGHEIGNHTYTHQEMTKCTWSALKAEIKKTDVALQKITGQQTVYLRLPKGSWDYRIFFLLLSLKKQLVFWNVDPRDYQAVSVSEILNKFRNYSFKSGDIVLLHDKTPSTVQALPELLHKVHRSNLKPVILSKLLNKP